MCIALIFRSMTGFLRVSLERFFPENVRVKIIGLTQWDAQEFTAGQFVSRFCNANLL